MLTEFVNLKRELTHQKEVFESIGFSTYRTRALCGCETGRNNRQAIIVINTKHSHKNTVIRCKACVARKEATNGNV